MRVSRLIAGLVFVGAPLGIASSVYARADSPERVELRRIRAHFDSVVGELNARDIGRLSPNQRSHRAQLVATLTAYRDRGVFPHNYDFPDRAMPYFIDRKTGTLCAVAHLLESTGRRDIVDRVARTSNNVWVAKLAGDTALAAWLDDNGLTLAEAARIQVPYVEPVSSAERARNYSFLTVGPVAVVASAVTSIWNSTSNADGHRRGVSWTGVTAGALTATAGVLLLTMSDAPSPAQQIGVASIGLGGLSMFTSSRSIRTHRRIFANQLAQRKSVADATLTPLIGLGGPTGTSVGASVTLKF